MMFLKLIGMGPVRSMCGYIWRGSSTLWNWFRSGTGGEVAKVIAAWKTDTNRVVGIAGIVCLAATLTGTLVFLYRIFSWSFVELIGKKPDQSASISTRLLELIQCTIFTCVFLILAIPIMVVMTVASTVGVLYIYGVHINIVKGAENLISISNY